MKTLAIQLSINKLRGHHAFSYAAYILHGLLVYYTNVRTYHIHTCVHTYVHIIAVTYLEVCIAMYVATYST